MSLSSWTCWEFWDKTTSDGKKFNKSALSYWKLLPLPLLFLSQTVIKNKQIKKTLIFFWQYIFIRWVNTLLPIRERQSRISQCPMESRWNNLKLIFFPRGKVHCLGCTSNHMIIVPFEEQFKLAEISLQLEVQEKKRLQCKPLLASGKHNKKVCHGTSLTITFSDSTVHLQIG